MFCQKCGTERVGESSFCANCGNSFNAPTMQAPIQNSNPVSSDLFKKAVETVKGLIKAPATTANKVANEGNTKLSLLLLAGQSVAGLIAAICFIISIAATGGGYMLKYASGLIVGLVFSSIIAPFVTNIVSSALFLLYANIITKEKKSFSSMLAIASVQSIPTTFAWIAAAILGFIFSLFAPSIGMFIVFVLVGGAMIASFFLAGSGLKGAGCVNDDKRFFVLLATFGTMLIVNMGSMRTMFAFVVEFVGGSLFSGLLGM